MGKDSKAAAAAGEAPSKKRKRSEEVVKVKAPKFRRVEEPSAVDAAKLEDEDVELVLLRVPTSVRGTARRGGGLGSRGCRAAAASRREGPRSPSSSS